MGAPKGKAPQRSEQDAVSAAGSGIVERFEYRFQSPVTVKRGESALLPFLHEGIDTEAKLTAAWDQCRDLEQNKMLLDRELSALIETADF